jgi:hypothetical protein
MPRQFFCSECGTNLDLKRKALKYKGIIVDLIDPHTCNKDNLPNITDLEKPKSPIINQFEEQTRAEEHRLKLSRINPAFSDRRSKADLRSTKSTAPPGVVSALSRVPTGSQESQTRDIDFSDEEA